MATAKKGSLKESTRRKGENRVAQQAALKKAKAQAKKPGGRAQFGASMTEKEGRALEKAKAAKEIKARGKSSGGVVGLAQKLRRRFPK